MLLCPGLPPSAHCDSAVPSLQLTFTLCTHYPLANNGAHSPTRSCCTPCVPKCQPGISSLLTAFAQSQACCSTPTLHKLSLPGHPKLLEGKKSGGMRKKKFQQQKKPSVLDLNWPKVQGCRDLNQQVNVILIIYP